MLPEVLRVMFPGLRSKGGHITFDEEPTQASDGRFPASKNLGSSSSSSGGGSSGGGSSSSSSSSSSSGGGSSSGSSRNNETGRAGGSNGGGGGGGGGSGRRREGGRQEGDRGHGAWGHPGPMLKVGERLTSVLFNPEETAGLFLNPEDGSLMFLRAPENDEDDAGGMPAVLATLIPAKPRAVERVKRIRREVIQERMEEAARGGAEEKRGPWRRVIRSMPFGKDGRWARRQREKAIENWGEIYLTMNSRGVLVRNCLHGLLVF